MNQELELERSGSAYETDDLTLGDYMQNELVAQHSRGKEKRKRQPTHQVLHGTFVLYRRYALCCIVAMRGSQYTFM